MFQVNPYVNDIYHKPKNLTISPTPVTLYINISQKVVKMTNEPRHRDCSQKARSQQHATLPMQAVRCTGGYDTC